MPGPLGQEKHKRFSQQDLAFRFESSNAPVAPSNRPKSGRLQCGSARQAVPGLASSW